MVRCVPGLRNPSIAFALLWRLAFPVLALAADQTPAPETAQRITDAERLVFLLQYVGADYAVAVRDGEVIDESESEAAPRATD